MVSASIIVIFSFLAIGFVTVVCLAFLGDGMEGKLILASYLLTVCVLAQFSVFG
jgi:hypothetical protein